MAAAKKPNLETYSAELLLELISGRPDPQKLRWLASDVRLDFGWTESGGSWNHWHLLLACALWAGISPEKVVPLIVAYLEAQLGETERADRPTLRFFGGTEQNANSYEMWRWAFALAVRLWALRHPEHPESARLLRLTARYNEVQTILLGLGAVPGSTTTGEILSTEERGQPRRDIVRPHAHRTGSQVWWPGPTLPQSGARSTPGHIGVDERLPLYCACAFGKLVDRPTEKRFGWTATLLRQLQREAEQPIVVPSMTALVGIRLLVPHHFLTWKQEGVRVNFMARLANGNTTSILGHVHHERENRGVYLFPWPGRIRSGLGAATCDLDVGPRPESPHRLIARSRFGEVTAALPARDPDSHIVMGPEGLRTLE